MRSEKYLSLVATTIKHFCENLAQRSVRPVPQSVTFDIVSRCFENKDNNCCETKICKNAIYLLITNLQIHFWLFYSLDVLAAGPGWPDNKQVAFLQKKNSQQLLFLSSKLLDTMSNVTDCDPSQTNLCNKSVHISFIKKVTTLNMILYFITKKKL